MYLQELAVVEHVGDHLVHVVRLVRRVGDERVEFRIDLVRFGAVQVRDVSPGRLVQVVRGQVGQQVAGEVDAVLLVFGLVVGDAGFDAVGMRAAELLEGHVLAGHRLDHVGAGDEHVRSPLHHEGEVGDGRGVDRAARARAHDQRDLRDDAGGHHVAVEDLGEQAERHHPFLDPGAAAVVDPDHRAAGLQRVIHDLDDLLAVDLAERAAEHGEILAEHADRAPVHGAVPDDHAVPVGPGGRDPEVRGAVPGQLVELGERARVEQQLDPLPGGQLASLVLLGHRLLRAGVHGLVPPPLEVGDLACGGVRSGDGFAIASGRGGGLGRHGHQAIGQVSPGN